MTVHMSKSHISSVFSVHRRPSAWCGTPAGPPCSRGPRGARCLLTLSSASWSSFGLACPLLYTARSDCATAAAPSALEHSFTTQNGISSMCSGNQLHQIEHGCLAGSVRGCFRALGTARTVSSERMSQSELMSFKKRVLFDMGESLNKEANWL